MIRPHLFLWSDFEFAFSESEGSECTGGLNTHCTLPHCLEGFERTLAISWK